MVSFDLEFDTAHSISIRKDHKRTFFTRKWRMLITSHQSVLLCTKWESEERIAFQYISVCLPLVRDLFQVFLYSFITFVWSKKSDILFQTISGHDK